MIGPKLPTGITPRSATLAAYDRAKAAKINWECAQGTSSEPALRLAFENAMADFDRIDAAEKGIRGVV